MTSQTKTIRNPEQLYKTRHPEFFYGRVEDGSESFWRVFNKGPEDEEAKAVGPRYASRQELLHDLSWYLESEWGIRPSDGYPTPIGRVHCGHTILGMKPYSFHEDDAHLFVVLAKSVKRDETEWATWLYNALTDSFVEGHYRLDYNEAMEDFGERFHRYR